MKSIHLGQFHNVVGAQMTPQGLSVWDNQDMEYFIEMVCPEPVTLVGGFGQPPEEGGFQFVEGIRLPAVRKVEIHPRSIHDTFEVRELRVHMDDTVDLKWDLYVPRGKA